MPTHSEGEDQKLQRLDLNAYFIHQFGSKSGHHFGSLNEANEANMTRRYGPLTTYQRLRVVLVLEAWIAGLIFVTVPRQRKARGDIRLCTRLGFVSQALVILEVLLAARCFLFGWPVCGFVGCHMPALKAIICGFAWNSVKNYLNHR